MSDLQTAEPLGSCCSFAHLIDFAYWNDRFDSDSLRYIPTNHHWNSLEPFWQFSWHHDCTWYWFVLCILDLKIWWRTWRSSWFLDLWDQRFLKNHSKLSLAIRLWFRWCVEFAMPSQKTPCFCSDLLVDWHSRFGTRWNCLRKDCCRMSHGSLIQQQTCCDRSKVEYGQKRGDCPSYRCVPNDSGSTYQVRLQTVGIRQSFALQYTNSRILDKLLSLAGLLIEYYQQRWSPNVEVISTTSTANSLEPLQVDFFHILFGQKQLAKASSSNRPS